MLIHASNKAVRVRITPELIGLLAHHRVHTAQRSRQRWVAGEQLLIVSQTRSSRDCRRLCGGGLARTSSSRSTCARRKPFLTVSSRRWRTASPPWICRLLTGQDIIAAGETGT